MRKLGFVISLYVLAMVIGGAASEALTLATGSPTWTEIIDVSDLTGGAGTDLTGDYYTPIDEYSVTVTNCVDKWDAWRVDVRKSDTSWHSDLVLHIKRTGEGSGPGMVTGGTDYQTVTDLDAAFFNGEGGRSGMYVQIWVSGMSVQVPPATYSTNIVLTVVDT